ncbi:MULTISPECIES: hypothetical protein [Gallibacterium]|uniref:Lipoprotein n=1 Tax=Gallibacterium genomosp. 3 TaxID=505345 RepID=A0A1A7Q4N8_9PAST|nr:MULTISPECIES: hypothetical protein [Gallibacterium]MDA3979513.1 hypothetical protein [Gallibacterium sp. AGMB14963]OBX09194.1 hypothetical protein QV07_05300 [Gallibacterium genomosp. 3]
MKKVLPLLLSISVLAGCALSPEEQRAMEQEKIRKQQALQVSLAKQCDEETAYLMKRQFDQDIGLTAQQQKAFKEEYTKKVNDPMFQACYKLALQNYMAEQQIRQMEIERQFYEDYPPYDLGPRWRRGHWYW